MDTVHVCRRARAVGLVGYGTIGRAVAQALLAGDVSGAILLAVLERDPTTCLEATARMSQCGVMVTSDPLDFLAEPLDLLVEVAGQEAVRAVAEPALRRGLDVLVVSTGAFTDDALYARLSDLAKKGEGRLFLAAGALPAVDWMSAAALAPVQAVTITQSKPVTSWMGTEAQGMVDLAAMTDASCFYEGSARQTASTFAKSSNITATLALATVGLDRTHVRLVADPTSDRMCTWVAFEGDAGTVTVEWQGVPSTTNPSTSADVSLAVIKAIRNWAADVVLGV